MKQVTDERDRTRTFAFWCMTAFVVRVIIVMTTIGTNDVVYNLTWLHLAQRFGIANAYAVTPLLNHPPLSLALMLIEAGVGRTLHVEFSDVFRLVQVAADGLSVFALYRIGKDTSRAEARSVALFFALSPTAAAISAFHCNTDPLMIGLTLGAAALIVREKPLVASCGCLLAAAANIKILPFLIVPFFLIRLSARQRLRFLGAFAVTAALLLLPAVAIGGAPVIRNVFGYTGMDQVWGFPELGLMWRSSPHAVLRVAAQVALAIARSPRMIAVACVLCLSILGARFRQGQANRTLPLALTGTLFLLLLFTGPGFGIQYLDWPIAFLPFALTRRTAVAVNAAISLFAFTCYTVWCEGFPWWFADLRIPHPHLRELTEAALVVWAILGLAGIAAVRRLAARVSE